MGDDCVALGQKCLADCRDTLYPFTVSTYQRNYACSMDPRTCTTNPTQPPCQLATKLTRWNKSLNISDVLCGDAQRGLLSDREDDMIFVVGVNHKVANVSEYSSLAVYDLKNLWGVESVGDSILNGTGFKFTSTADLQENPVLEQALPYLYAYQIKRRCDHADEGVSCISVPSAEKSDGLSIFVPLSHPVGFAERMYNSPVSHIGPSTTEIVLPIQIHLKLRSLT